MPDRIGAACAGAEQGRPMKFAYMLGLAGALVYAPVSHAQITCAQAEKITAAAVDDFDSMAGEEAGDTAYEALFLLDGATGCQITLDFSSAYSCMWTFASLEAAQSAFGGHTHALADCYGEWDREAYTANSTEPGAKTLDGRSFFSVDDDGAEFTWITYLEEHVAADGRDWHVWVGLDYF